MSNCPDIIPFGTTPVGDPYDYFIVNSWDKDLGKALTAKMQNYIYLRAQNAAGKQQTGRLYLYWAKASLILYPSLWQDNVITTGNGKDHFEFTVGKDGKLVSSDALQGTFVWNPEMLPQNDHYCLIGRIVTPDHPASIPPIGRITDLGKFISENPNFGWRNIAVVDKDTPNYSFSIDYKQGDEGGKMNFLLCCTGVPVDAEVSFTARNTSGVQPLVQLPRTKVQTSNEEFGIASDVPANWESAIEVDYWTNGKAPLQDWKLDMKVVFFVPSDHELYRYCKTPEELGVLSHLTDQKVGPLKGIVLGSFGLRGV